MAKVRSSLSKNTDNKKARHKPRLRYRFSRFATYDTARERSMLRPGTHTETAPDR